MLKDFEEAVKGQGGVREEKKDDTKWNIPCSDLKLVEDPSLINKNVFVNLSMFGALYNLLSNFICYRDLFNSYQNVFEIWNRSDIDITGVSLLICQHLCFERSDWICW